MTEKIYPITPVSHGFYSPGEYFCTEKYSEIEQEKRYKFFKKGNRGSKSKSRKESKSSSKRRSKESYRVVNKLLKVTSQQKLK